MRAARKFTTATWLRIALTTLEKPREWVRERETRTRFPIRHFVTATPRPITSREHDLNFKCLADICTIGMYGCELQDYLQFFRQVRELSVLSSESEYCLLEKRFFFGQDADSSQICLKNYRQLFFHKLHLYFLWVPGKSCFLARNKIISSTMYIIYGWSEDNI